MRPCHFLISLLFLLLCSNVYGQQDVDFKLIGNFLPGKKILKTKRDFNDPYLWVLTANNGVYRVNSNTLIVDDYTGAFAAYSNLDFIDIAGFNQNQAFIATNSTNVIAFKSGALKVFGQGDGLLHIVNSVGVSNFGNVIPIGKVVIGTAKGMGLLDPGTYQFNYITGNINDEIRVFDAGYRSFVFKSSANTNMPQGVPINLLGDFVSIVGEIYPVGGSGNNVKTVYGTKPVILTTSPGYQTYFFWGNENGMFQVPFQNINYSNPLYGHYLDHVSVNKIADIYGLASLGNPYFNLKPYTFTKQNLLIGTSQGLFFSNSIYGQYAGGLQSFALQHYDALGNININDICVNGTASTYMDTPTGCENGVWVAADDGLYLLKPDYSKYLDPTQRLKAISFNIANGDDITETSVCGGGSIQMAMNLNTLQNNLIQWYKDGVALPGATGNTLTVTMPGDYYATLHELCEGIIAETNHLKVDAGASPVFTFPYPSKIANCNTNPVVLKTDNNPAYSYRWYTNGILNGQTTSLFTVTGSGKYKVEVSACSGSWVASKEVEVDFIKLPTPVVMADKSAYCLGDEALLSIAALPDPAYTINWYKNGLLLAAGANKNALVATTSGIYTVTLTSNQPDSDGTVCTTASAARSLTFESKPTVSIQKIIKTTLCDGQSVDLKVQYDNGTIKWSTGDTNDQITVTHSGTYTVFATLAAGCFTSATTDLTFLPNPVLNIPDGVVCSDLHKTVTLTAPAGLKSYLWNGVAGTETYTADHVQTVTLTVTDANGCTATQEIHITGDCPDLKIPNTFTPNGDGVNDLWAIAGLTTDQTAVVKVFNRLGQVIYDNKGYAKPWNGEYNGRKLPAGVYFYVISAKSGTQTYNGSITVVY